MKGVERNSYIISVGDDIWFNENILLPPRELLIKLIERKFDNFKEFSNSEESLAITCFKFVDENKEFFNNNPIDKKKYEAFKKSDKNNYSEIINNFYYLWRGFTNHELSNAVKTIPADKKEIQQLLENVKEKIKSFKCNTLISDFKKKRIKGISPLLKNIKKDFIEIFKIDKQKLAQEKLSYDVFFRRKKILPGFDLLDDDYTGLKYKIRQCDPNEISFPCRFLIFFSSHDYFELKNKWRKGETKEQLLKCIIQELNWNDFFNDLIKRFEIIENEVQKSRKDAINEVRFTWFHNQFLAATLLSITQTEGLLWDFAEYLNSKSTKIWELITSNKNNYYPYLWDQSNENYKFKDGCIELSNDKLISARDLLNRTKLGYIISKELFWYLIDEFYDDRNSFTHGDILNRDLKQEAAASILCFATCLEEILRYSESR